MTVDQEFKNIRERLEKVVYLFAPDKDHAKAVQQLLNDARWLADQLQLSWKHIEDLQPKEYA